MKTHINNPRNKKYLLIRNGYEIEVRVFEDQLGKFRYQVFANYKGFERHNAVYVSNDITQAVEEAINLLFEDYPFERIIYL